MTDEVQKSGIGKKFGQGVLLVAAVLVGLTVLGAIVEKDKPAAVPEPVEVATGAPPPFQSVAPVQAVALVEEPTGTLTGPQNNAARSAQQYISMSGFSRDGLINQLSSDAGEGYNVADATVAADSLNVDWDTEAVESARQYLTMTGFSCRGLFEQLSSSVGDKYTVRQATYGAKQAGAC